ncbi:MAG: GHMP kinase [Candidatus Schekmanbacteria bacterium RIFCSPHIGHO2_02_FULL_38_11]|uniref:GHMP kinase n=1 Tax=Candidatus Schekmanbacteria bacterium RIFCSPLOWO2_12_FULL_38_15 TaxID=1817883 RepID=A0A1F7SGR8_9BACT|nr:MAG: GHMP kinase [Candidatus Schekmanbacteria bacterium GWA2_38_9]OGL49629.1 MAG: GHMP kinase [Candidatus Schekmanbacteria bacterium RIFCSPLOWO2_02_FULL_38_14]OGL50351.1 MAG: GHMP kinase [Candidatus Schekmanbacteria bacterium RIFCSPHIGHO2_02_FULL_38_11]OGL52982.1 MAG: GHMP kinase [Candidatus Schekmanbacteria bacterium RIFCSPLOWO2_12_FULL_38_15]
MIISQTPLRISFAGGGTDFKDYYKNFDGGVVISTAIDKYVYVIIKKRFDKNIRIGYSITELVDEVDSIKHDLVREGLKRAKISGGVEISTMADIPSTGSGLGSSSSVTVGLLNAMYAFQGIQKTSEELAKEACEIEIDILKKPIGKQDQYIAAYGSLREIHFKKDGKVKVDEIKIPEEVKEKLNRNLLLFYTGEKRDSSTVLLEQKNNINTFFNTLNEMKAMVPEFKKALQKGEIDEFGRLLHSTWEYKKSLASKITNSHIDKLYEKAIDAGALGGKIAGAGGGGFLLLYCPYKKQDKVKSSLTGLKELKFGFERDGSKIIFNINK